MKLHDVAVGAYLDAGCPMPEAVAMATFYRHYLLAMIVEVARGLWSKSTDALSQAKALGIELIHMDEASHDCPSLSGATELLTSIQPERLFVVGLKVLLDGMDCRLEEISPSVQASLE